MKDFFIISRESVYDLVHSRQSVHSDRVEGDKEEDLSDDWSLLYSTQLESVVTEKSQWRNLKEILVVRMKNVTLVAV